MPRVFVYVVVRDFGFAPNPFHGYCTLATCKPGIRASARVGDWVIGMGGARLEATGRCVFGMLVTEALTFNEYWSNPTHLDKKPVRNGSRRMMVGDNIYHFDRVSGQWHQADSHHSNPDGTPNSHNVLNDTKADRVLLSRHFFYFGKEAPAVPVHLLTALNFRNGRNYRVFDYSASFGLVEWIGKEHRHALNIVAADPFDFPASERRYSVHDDRIR
jgi:hypothetical protein